MASYYPGFYYLGVSSKEKNLIVVSFEGDSGEVDTYLGMDPIYTESAYGTSRLDYGAKYNNVATVKISVIKQDGSDFSVAEVRDCLRWLTGARKTSTLDLTEHYLDTYTATGVRYGFGLRNTCDHVCYVKVNDEIQSQDVWVYRSDLNSVQFDTPPEKGATIKVVYDKTKYSFIGRVTNVWQQKMDARTIGLVIEFTSVSPWAYSPIQHASYSLEQSLSVNSNGVAYKDGNDTNLEIDENGVLYNNSLFNITNDGVVYIDETSILQINNKTDDLYAPIYLNAVFYNGTSSYLSIKNVVLDEETLITGIKTNEVITLNENQFILSDSPGKIFGNTFNFIWPRLVPGINNFIVSGDGDGSVEFTYRYPIKLGDVAIDLDTISTVCEDYIYSGNDSTSSGNTSSSNNTSNTVSWSDITNKPTTRDGYNIQDVYTKTEVDQEIDNASANVDSTELNTMLSQVLSE